MGRRPGGGRRRGGCDLLHAVGEVYTVADSMDARKAVDILSGRRGGAGAALLRGVLRAASWPYAGAMRLRRWAYRRGLLKSRAASVPVICVGNLTTGGTGKTPMVVWVVERLKEAGRRPAVLTRGYGAAPAEGARVVGEAAADEPALLERLTGAAVIVSADRVAGAEKAVAGGADVLVMDDGYQHRRLRRDLDIVLIDAVEPLGFGYCLPRGLLREPASALADAGAVVLTHADEVSGEALSALAERLRALAAGAAFCTAVHASAGLIDGDGRDRPVSDLVGRRVFAFCGLAAPEHFFAALSGLGAVPAGRRALADHVVYTPQRLAELAAEADAADAEILLTTQKDHVKLAGMDVPRPIWQLAVRMEVTGGADALVGLVRAAAGA